MSSMHVTSISLLATPALAGSLPVQAGVKGGVNLANTRVEDDATEIEITYDRLQHEAAAVAAGLKERGLRPGDTACKTLATRCETYARTPPPEDWSGAVRLTRK